MLERFVITEFFRKPDEDDGLTKIWFHKRTWKEKRVIIIIGNENFDCFYDEDGKLHRDHGQPAVLRSTECEKYYFHGKLHRGHFEPAVIYQNGKKEYWVYGEKRFETLALIK